MSYRYDRQKKNKQRWYFLGAFFLALVLFTPAHQWVFGILERPFVYTWENKQNLESKGTNIFESLFFRQKIEQENHELKQEITRLEIDNLRTNHLVEQLEYYVQYTNEIILPAFILHRGFFNSRDTLIIRYQNESILKEGDVLLAFDNLVLGRVTDVYAMTARVRLYSHSHEQVSGILYPHNISLTAQGYGNGGFLIEAPRQIEVQEGDVFYSQEFPGKIIAVVRAVEFDARDPFKKVFLSYPIDINTVHMVGVQKTSL